MEPALPPGAATFVFSGDWAIALLPFSVVGLAPNEIEANGEALLPVADNDDPLPDDRKANGELAEDLVAATLPNPLKPLKTPVDPAATAPPSALSSPPTPAVLAGTLRLATLIVRCFISSSDALRNSPCSSWSSSSSQLSWVSSFPGRRLADIFPMDNIEEGEICVYVFVCVCVSAIFKTGTK